MPNLNRMLKAVVLLVLFALMVLLAPSAAAADEPTAAQDDPSPLEATASWMLDRMLTAAPPARGRTYPDAVETKEEGAARYAEIAKAIAEVAYDPNEKPLFGGKYARARTAMLLLSVAWHEGGLRKDVDFGKGKWARGDSGRSCTLYQFNIGKGTNMGGHTCDELLADRRLAARDALALLRLSMSTCRSLPVADRLSVYTSGKCQAGEPKSEARFGTAVRFFDAKLPPSADAAVVENLRTISQAKNSETSEAVARQDQ